MRTHLMGFRPDQVFFISIINNLLLLCGGHAMTPCLHEARVFPHLCVFFTLSDVPLPVCPESVYSMGLHFWKGSGFTFTGISTHDKNQINFSMLPDTIRTTMLDALLQQSLTLLILAILVFTVAGLGRLLLSRTNLTDISFGEMIFYSGGIGFGVTGYCVFFLGLLDGFHPLPILILLLFLSFLALHSG